MAKKYEGSLWIKNGGGVLILKDGRKINKGERFNARKIDIPKPFLKSLTLVEAEAKVPAKEKEEGEDLFKLVEVSKGFYNIQDADGKMMSEKKLRKGPAEILLGELLADGDEDEDPKE